MPEAKQCKIMWDKQSLTAPIRPPACLCTCGRRAIATERLGALGEIFGSGVELLHHSTVAQRDAAPKRASVTSFERPLTTPIIAYHTVGG